MATLTTSQRIAQLNAQQAAKLKAFEKANMSDALIKLPFTTPIQLAINTVCAQLGINKEIMPRSMENMNGHLACAVLFHMPVTEKDLTLIQWKNDYQSIINRAHEEFNIYSSKWNSLKQLSKIIGQKCPYYVDDVF